MGLKSYFAEKCITHEVTAACDLLSGGGLFSLTGLEVATMFVAWCLIYTLPMALSWSLLMSKSLMTTFLAKGCLFFAYLASTVGVLVQVTLPSIVYFIELFMPSEKVWETYYSIYGRVPNDFIKYYIEPVRLVFDWIF